jgi:hypothetical protein
MERFDKSITMPNFLSCLKGFSLANVGEVVKLASIWSQVNI